MPKKNRLMLLSPCLIVCALMLGSPTAWAEKDSARSVVFVSAPIGGTLGQTLRVTVAVTPAADGRAIGDNLVSIEAGDYDATDLPPIAELARTEVVAGRGAQFDFEFRPSGDAGSRQTVVLRATIRVKEPSKIGPIVGSIEIFDTATGKGMLWGDWFIVDRQKRRR